MHLEPSELERGTDLFRKHLEEIQSEEPELTDFHSAFEHYCMNKYSLGSAAVSERTAGSNDLGIDFFSSQDRHYHVAQCKIPEADWLEANPKKVKIFGPGVLSDPRSALEYLVGDSKAKPNDRVKRLFTLIETDRAHDDFSLAFILIVYGRLNDRAEASFKELKSDYAKKNVRVVLQQVDDLVDEFILGASRENAPIRFDLRIDDKRILQARDYCYFLANAADLFTAFKDYGWRLFDLNLRYEVRNSPVNGDIITSLSHQRTRRKFHHFNNGLIIVTEGYSIRDNQSAIRLTGAQIVNGLQTVKSIYNAVAGKEVTLSQLESDCVIQVKAIRAEDPTLVSDIVQATNNQNPMAPRNLKANNREQKALRTEFSSLKPRWFYQLKENEWESLTQEAGRFFKQVIGFPPIEFRPEPGKKKGRVIDNQQAAKAWLAFMGFADYAGDRVTHYFENPEVYSLAFTMRPQALHWQRFAEMLEFDKGRRETLENKQASASQYLLAFGVWQFAKNFIPSPQRSRETALDEGVKAGEIEKHDDLITSPQTVQEIYLATNLNYQVWRLMANMKELLVEATAYVLVKKYGALDSDKCSKLLLHFDLKDFVNTAEIRAAAQNAASANDLSHEQLFGRIFGFLKHVSTQFWEEKEKQLLSTSRLRTALLNRHIAADFKRKIEETNLRKALDKPWKPENVTFMDSLPATLG
jgi:hypothetical protein